MKKIILLLAVIAICITPACRKEDRFTKVCRFYKDPNNNWVQLDCVENTLDNKTAMSNYPDGTSRDVKKCEDCADEMAKLPR